MLFRGFRIAVSFNMPKARFHLSFEVTCPFCRLNFGSSVLNTVLTISVKHWLPSVLLFDLCQNPVHRAFGSSLVLPLSLIQAIADSHLYGSWGFLLHYSDLEFTSIFIFFFSTSEDWLHSFILLENRMDHWCLWYLIWSVFFR